MDWLYRMFGSLRGQSKQATENVDTSTPDLTTMIKEMYQEYRTRKERNCRKIAWLIIKHTHQSENNKILAPEMWNVFSALCGDLSPAEIRDILKEMEVEWVADGDNIYYAGVEWDESPMLDDLIASSAKKREESARIRREKGGT